MSIGHQRKGIDVSSELTNWLTSDIDNGTDGVKKRPAAAATIMKGPTMMQIEAIEDEDPPEKPPPKLPNTDISSQISKAIT